MNTPCLFHSEKNERSVLQPHRALRHHLTLSPLSCILRTCTCYCYGYCRLPHQDWGDVSRLSLKLNMCTRFPAVLVVFLEPGQAIGPGLTGLELHAKEGPPACGQEENAGKNAGIEQRRKITHPSDWTIIPPRSSLECPSRSDPIYLLHVTATSLRRIYNK